MTFGNSKTVTSQQVTINDKLDRLALRYREEKHLKPIHAHSQAAFADMSSWLDDWTGPLILDACCGVGESSARLAAWYPQARIIAIDKSQARLAKHGYYASQASNYRVFRADILDMLALMVTAGWHFHAQYWWYPNPYPNKHQVQKRWHASPAMPLLMALGGEIEVRSNWRIYLQEFAYVASYYGRVGDITEVESANPVTPFERKYIASGQPCWKLSVTDGENLRRCEA